MDHDKVLQTLKEVLVQIQFLESLDYDDDDDREAKERPVCDQIIYLLLVLCEKIFGNDTNGAVLKSSENQDVIGNIWGKFYCYMQYLVISELKKLKSASGLIIFRNIQFSMFSAFLASKNLKVSPLRVATICITYNIT